LIRLDERLRIDKEKLLAAQIHYPISIINALSIRNYKIGWGLIRIRVRIWLGLGSSGYWEKNIQIGFTILYLVLTIYSKTRYITYKVITLLLVT